MKIKIIYFFLLVSLLLSILTPFVNPTLAGEDENINISESSDPLCTKIYKLENEGRDSDRQFAERTASDCMPTGIFTPVALYYWGKSLHLKKKIEEKKHILSILHNAPYYAYSNNLEMPQNLETFIKEIQKKATTASEILILETLNKANSEGTLCPIKNGRRRSLSLKKIQSIIIKELKKTNLNQSQVPVAKNLNPFLQPQGRIP